MRFLLQELRVIPTLKRLFLISALIFFHDTGFSQVQDTLTINYFSRAPFAYTDNGQPKGIEVDIMNEYILWLKAKKKLNITFKYVAFSDFESFYNATKKGGKNCIGLGAVTVSPDKAKE